VPQPPIERIISLSTVEIAGTKRALTWGERTFAGINEGRRMGGNSMNLKKNFQRFLVLRKRFGTGATLFDLVYRSLERSIGLNMYRIVGVNIKDFDASRWPKADFAAPREFGRDELLAFSGAAPDHLPREFVEQALAAGNRCFGVVIDGKLAAYSWFSRKPTEMDHQLEISFNPDMVYQYKAYVLQEFRGKRLSPYILHHALCCYAEEGVEHAVAYIAANNYPSLRAAKGFGFSRLGTAYVWNTKRSLSVYATRGCISSGLRISRKRLAGPDKLQLVQDNRSK
jgi:hypothetical protein